MHSSGHVRPCASANVDREPSLSAQLVFRLYKGLVSPVLHSLSPSSCLYLPTCSEYTYIALARFGTVKGGRLALRRLLRCNPFAKGGLDPVPEAPVPSDHLP